MTRSAAPTAMSPAYPLARPRTGIPARTSSAQAPTADGRSDWDGGWKAGREHPWREVVMVSGGTLGHVDIVVGPEGGRPSCGRGCVHGSRPAQERAGRKPSGRETSGR